MFHNALEKNNVMQRVASIGDTRAAFHADKMKMKAYLKPLEKAAK
jgi:hypothetical protein